MRGQIRRHYPQVKLRHYEMIDARQYKYDGEQVFRYLFAEGHLAKSISQTAVVVGCPRFDLYCYFVPNGNKSPKTGLTNTYTKILPTTIYYEF